MPNDEPQVPVPAPAPAPAATTPNPPEPSPRPLVRALVVAGLSVLSAAVLWIWLIGPVLLRGRHDRSELYAVSYCRAYVTAQIVYKRGGAGRPAFAHPYPELVRTALDAGTASETERVWALAEGPGGTPARGYLFQDMKSIAGKPVDWAQDFALCATPAKYGGARRRTFIVSTAGTTWAKDLGRSEFVADFHADPAAAGWRIAE